LLKIVWSSFNLKFLAKNDSTLCVTSALSGSAVFLGCPKLSTNKVMEVFFYWFVGDRDSPRKPPRRGERGGHAES